MSQPSTHLFSLRSALAWSLGFHVCLLLAIAIPFGDASGLRAPALAVPFAATSLIVRLGTAAPAAFETSDKAIPSSQEVASLDAAPLQEAAEPSNAAINEGTQANLGVAGALRHDAVSYRAPQLLTDVGSEIYGATQNGSIIVRVDVDAAGQPSNLIRLYSDVEPQLALTLEQRILAAKFRPAEQDGIALAGTLEIRVTVAPSQEMRTLFTS